MLLSWAIVIITDQLKEVNFLFTEHSGKHSILCTLLVLAHFSKFNLWKFVFQLSLAESQITSMIPWQL